MTIDCPNCGRVTVSSFTLSQSPNYRSGTCPSCKATVAANSAPAARERQHLSFFASLFADIHKAAEAGDVEAVKRCLHRSWFKADVNAIDYKNGRTALHIAANKGHYAVAKLLLAEGADVNALTDNGLTPLDFIPKSGDYFYEHHADKCTAMESLLRSHGGVSGK